jgi:hypothetical protein
MQFIHKVEADEVKVLIILEKNANHWIQSADIASELSLGKSKIQKIIKMLQKRISEQFADEISIEVSTNKGILYIRSKPYSISEIIETIYVESLTYKLINSILHERLISMEKFSMDNFVSVASVRRLVSHINQVIADDNIAIKNNKFIGNEYNIRSFLFKYYWEIYKGGKWPFDVVSYDRLFEIASTISQGIEIYVSSTVQRQICYYLAISKTRNSKGYFLDANHEIDKLAHNNPIYEYAKEKWVDFYFLSSEYEVEIELRYYFYIISSFSIDFEKTNIDRVKNLLDVFRSQDTNSYHVTKYLLDDIIQTFKLDLSDDQLTFLFVEVIMIHQQAHLLSASYSIGYKSNYITKLKENFPTLYGRLTFLVDEIICKISTCNFDKNILLDYYSLLHFNLVDKEFYADLITVGVELSNGHTIETIISKEINDRFCGKYSIMIVRATENPDVLITDARVGHYASEDIVYLLTSHLDEVDFNNIETAIQNSLKRRIQCISSI